LVTRTSATEESWSIIKGVLKEDVVVIGSALAAIEESCSIITGVLREDVVVVGDNLALAVTVTKGNVTDDICLAVEMKTNNRTVDHNMSTITLVLIQSAPPKPVFVP